MLYIKCMTKAQEILTKRAARLGNQKKLAAHLGMPETTISRLLRGGVPGGEMCWDLEQKLKIRLRDWFQPA